jgi:hypothetical protein
MSLCEPEGAASSEHGVNLYRLGATEVRTEAPIDCGQELFRDEREGSSESGASRRNKHRRCGPRPSLRVEARLLSISVPFAEVPKTDAVEMKLTLGTDAKTVRTHRSGEAGSATARWRCREDFSNISVAGDAAARSSCAKRNAVVLNQFVNDVSAGFSVGGLGSSECSLDNSDFLSCSGGPIRLTQSHVGQRCLCGFLCPQER